MSTFNNNNNNNNNIFRKRDYDNAFVMEIKALFDQDKAAKTVGDDDLMVSAFFEDLDHQVEYIDDGGEENDEDDFVCSVAEALADVSSSDDETTSTTTATSSSSAMGSTQVNVVIPDQPFNFRERHSIRQFAYAKLSGISLNVSDDHIKMQNSYFKEFLLRYNISLPHVKPDLLSTKATLRVVHQKLSSVSAFVSHETCINGCYLFDSVTDQSLTSCPVCSSSGRTYVKICSLARKIAYLLCSEDKRVALRYRHDNYGKPKSGDNTSYDDIFDADVYQECLKRGLFNLPDSVAIALNVDGFSSKFSNKSFVIVHAVLLNYSPVERLKGDNVFEVAVFCGNHKKNLRSLLRPIIKELETFGRSPVEVFRNGDHVTSANIHCLTLTGDLVELNSLMDFAGFVARYGCKQCLTLGEHPVDSCESCVKSGMYFPKRDQAERTKGHLLLLEEDNSVDHKNYGINAVNMCKDVPVFDIAGTYFHGLDELHLFSNVTKLVYAMIASNLSKAFKFVGNEGAYPFRINKVDCALIEEALKLTKSNVPNIFAGSWQPFNPSTSLSKYRSVDYIDILRYVMPTLIAPRLVNKTAGKALGCLCRGVSLAMQRCLSGAEVSEIKSNINVWFDFLDKCVADRSISLTVFRINMHLLSHLSEIIKKLGPMTAYSVRTMERSIGSLKKKMKASNRAGINAGNIIEIDQLIDFIDVHQLVDLRVDVEEVKDNSERGLSPNDPSDSRLRGPFAKQDISFRVTDASKTIGGVLFKHLAKAIIHMNARHQGNKRPTWDDHQIRHKIKIAAKMADGKFLYGSDFYRHTNTTIQKEGYYALFEENKRVFRQVHEVLNHCSYFN
ncbi:hypothetical protein EDC96DRAFT_595496 [Choanephora cucurbitarum]|nr:hypothetical protein EDC96DRAFT_595496 [Choanephora cucurbitarum]